MVRQIVNDILQEPQVILHVATKSTLASKVLSHCHSVIEDLPCNVRYKLGLTLHPVHRWCNREYGYQHVRFPQFGYLKALAILEHGEAAAYLEAALISKHHADPRCLNEAGGGEAVAKDCGPFFIYVAVSKLPE